MNEHREPAGMVRGEMPRPVSNPWDLRRRMKHPQGTHFE